MENSLLPLLFLFALSSFVSCSTKEAYLFSYFEDEKDGLHLAYSYDGISWTALNGDRPVMAPKVGEHSLMRDPSITQGPDGTFHLVWTTGWADRIIGYASSKDLVNWSEQKAIPVMTDWEGAKNCWAPELFYDSPTKTYYIIWSTILEGDPEGMYHIYCTTTKDFETFSPTRLFFGSDRYGEIDAAIVRKPHSKELFFVYQYASDKNDKYLCISKSTDIGQGFPETPLRRITSNEYWCEGGSPLFAGERFIVYFDKTWAGQFGAVMSEDGGNTWTDISEVISVPKGIRHGTAFKSSPSVVRSLREVLGED